MKTMPEYIFTVLTDKLIASPNFKEASREELRVLIAVISVGKAPTTVEHLANISETSLARAKAALTLFEECGVIVKSDTGSVLGEVIYEFETKNKLGAPVRETPIEAAKSIRDNNLYELQNECENLLGKSLSSYEIGTLTSLYTQLGLSAQYILLLLAHLTETRKKVTVSGLARIAEELVKQEIDTLEDLEKYIQEKSNEVQGEMEMRRLLGIRDRTLTPTERKYFRRWLHEYCYSIPIIGEAYDICVHKTGKINLTFMDAVLKGWHDAGCKTLEECIAQEAIQKDERAKKRTQKKSDTKVEAEVPKYADFNTEDALLRALERSYSEND